jgi:hypothetical protein
MSERHPAGAGTTGPSGTRDVAREMKALDKVRRRVAAIGFFVITIHGVLGLIVVGHIVDGQGRHGDAIGLVIMSGVVALIQYAGCRFILGARLWSPVWILLSLVPTAFGLFLVV